MKKYCGKCFTWKERSEYHKDKYNPDGLYLYCKVCRLPKHKLVVRKYRERLKERTTNI
jgi:hypothetical protein